MSAWRGLLAGGFAPLVLAASAWAAPGDLDGSFSRDGYTRVAFGTEYSEGTSVALDDRGRIVVAGLAGTTKATPFVHHEPQSVLVARLTRDGKLDRTFSGDGRVLIDAGPAPDVRGLAIDAGGRIVVTGSAGGDLFAVRLLSGGALDSSFAADGIGVVDAGGSETGGSVALEGDGIVLGGTTCAAGSCQFALARLGAAGLLDPGFGTAGVTRTDFPGSNSHLRALDLTPDGGLVAGGESSSQDTAVSEYTPDGVLDPGFNGGGRAVISEFTNGISDMEVDDAGRIVALGGLGKLFRILPSVTLDPSFGDNYFGSGGMTIDGAGRVIVGARFGGCSRFCEPLNTGVIRSDATGRRDKAFGTFRGSVVVDLGAVDDAANEVVADPHDRPITVGFSGSQLAVARFEAGPGPHDLDADGSRDGDDRCPGAFSRTHRGCPHVTASLTLRRRAGEDLWVGKLSASLARCSVGRELAVFRRGERYDTELAGATTDGNGLWEADGNLTKGTYYAKAARFSKHGIVCREARSNEVTIR